MDDLKNSLGFRYLQETKFDEQTLWRKPRLDIAPAHPYKQYAEAEKIKLPTDWEMDKSLHEALQNRRSCRRYTDTPLSMESLAMLLWASQGISGRAGNFFFRTAPSAGALYPVETYLSIQNVESLPPGLYHFQPADFGLERISDVFLREKVWQRLPWGRILWLRPGLFLSGQPFCAGIFQSTAIGVCVTS